LGDNAAEVYCTNLVRSPATPAEVEMALAAGASCVNWAYPTTNQVSIRRVIASAGRYPHAKVIGMVDSPESLVAWIQELDQGPSNVGLRIDLDSGLGRTGVVPGEEALSLARAVQSIGRFEGWHIYDGHNKGTREVRAATVHRLASEVRKLQDGLEAEGIRGDVLAGGSYSFDLWPRDLVSFVSPGSFTYSSAQHETDLSDLGWKPAAFVLTTVVSRRAGTATLDAGSKAISPDKSLKERFLWPGDIVMMNEEHSVVEAGDLVLGDKVLLLPGHTCTAAYLYDQALVKTARGVWEVRPQLGGAR
jgi:D-serine deaminase-like pyridoxal phosphate-dependent protein